MDDFIKGWWLTMGEKRLRNHLTNTLRLPAPLIADTMRQVLDIKATLRAAKTKKTVHFKLWDAVLSPARVELQNVRTRKYQLKQVHENQFDAQRWEALTRYETVIMEAIAWMKKAQKEMKTTPSGMPERFRAEGKSVGDGQHWTDYVPPKQRREIAHLFDALPPPRNGIAKVPFPRKIDRKVHEKQRHRLSMDIEAEKASIEKALDMAETEEDQDALSAQLLRVQEADFILFSKGHTDPLPSTWQQLLNK